MTAIPRIIHQIWSGIDEPLPLHFKILGDTWRRDYPDWEYIQWDNKMMNNFIIENYPQYLDIYNRFPYNVQRWDAIRYLILEKMGGMYVDFDYESIKSIESLVKNKECCFSQEPEFHCQMINKPIVFNNALMLSAPNHVFIRSIIDEVFSEKALCPKEGESKGAYIVNSTGPWMLLRLYEMLMPIEQKEIYLIPYKYVTPFDMNQAKMVRSGVLSDELEKCLDEAYAVHYFFGGWYI